MPLPSYNLCGASNLSCKQTNAFRLDSPWGATLMSLKACAMVCRPNRILRVSENSGPILSRLWTKVHNILGQCRGPSTFQLPYPVFYSCVVQKIFAIKSRSRWKPKKCKSFWPSIFLGGKIPIFLRQIVSAIYCPPFGKVWLSSLSDLRLRSLAMKLNA